MTIKVISGDITPTGTPSIQAIDEEPKKGNSNYYDPKAYPNLKSWSLDNMGKSFICGVSGGSRPKNKTENLYEEICKKYEFSLDKIITTN